MTAEVVAVTAAACTAKVAFVWPLRTVTLTGTVAEAWLLERLTSAPLAGAGPLSVTVPVVEPAPTITFEASATDASVAGLTMMVVDCV